MLTGLTKLPCEDYLYLSQTVDTMANVSELPITMCEGREQFVCVVRVYSKSNEWLCVTGDHKSEGHTNQQVFNCVLTNQNCFIKKQTLKITCQIHQYCNVFDQKTGLT